MIYVYNQLTFHEKKVLICLRESKPRNLKFQLWTFLGEREHYIWGKIWKNIAKAFFKNFKCEKHIYLILNAKFKGKFSEKSKVLSIRVPESKHSQIKHDVNRFITLLLKDKTNSLSIVVKGINESLQFLNDFQVHFKYHKSLKKIEFYTIQSKQIFPLINKLNKCLKILS